MKHILTFIAALLTNGVQSRDGRDSELMKQNSGLFTLVALSAFLGVHDSPAGEASAGLLAQVEPRIKAIYERDEFAVRSFTATWLPDGSGYSKLETLASAPAAEVARYDAAGGKRPSKVPQLDAATAEEFIRIGRGWDNRDRYSFYDKLSDDELVTDLCSWSPIVRERAGIALGRRKDSPVARVVALLDSPTLDARLGACQAIAHLKGRAGSAVPALRTKLRADDLWLRIKAAEALAAIGKPAMQAVPEMLELLARFDAQEDPRGMQQRFFTFALFDSREGLLGRSLEGVDRQQLYQAVRAGLKNEDGRARSDFGSVYRNLSAEAIKPLLPAILQAVVEPAPSGEMFADGIRGEGLRVLAQHHVEEGILACVDYIRGQNPWASEHRTPELTKILVSYGANAKTVVPELERIAADFAAGEPEFPKNLSLKKAAALREAIREIQASNDRPELIRIK
jgi:hypothetical protein